MVASEKLESKENQLLIIMKNLKKISRENLKSITGGAAIGKKCCGRNNCGDCVYWVNANQYCPVIIIPEC